MNIVFNFLQCVYALVVYKYKEKVCVTINKDANSWAVNKAGVYLHCLSILKHYFPVMLISNHSSKIKTSKLHSEEQRPQQSAKYNTQRSKEEFSSKSLHKRYC